MRKVTEEFKERLREAFRVYGKSGVPEEALLGNDRHACHWVIGSGGSASRMV